MKRTRAGFTLVELLIVVQLLAILAALVVPGFEGYPDFTRRSSLVSNLNILRTGIECYYLQHDGIFPGNLGADQSWNHFVAQMTAGTDRSGNPGTRYGPYLRNEIPQNPFNNLNTGKVGNFPAGPDGTTGWYYNPITGEIRPNHADAPWGNQEEVEKLAVDIGATKF